MDLLESHEIIFTCGLAVGIALAAIFVRFYGARPQPVQAAERAVVRAAREYERALANYRQANNGAKLAVAVGEDPTANVALARGELMARERVLVRWIGELAAREHAERVI